MSVALNLKLKNKMNKDIKVTEAGVSIEAKINVENWTENLDELVEIFGSEYVGKRFAFAHLHHVLMGDARRELVQRFAGEELAAYKTLLNDEDADESTVEDALTAFEEALLKGEGQTATVRLEKKAASIPKYAVDWAESATDEQIELLGKMAAVIGFDMDPKDQTSIARAKAETAKV